MGEGNQGTKERGRGGKGKLSRLVWTILAALISFPRRFEAQALLERALDKRDPSLEAFLFRHLFDPFPLARQRLVFALPPPANLLILLLDLALVSLAPFPFFLVVDPLGLGAVLLLFLLGFGLFARKDRLELLLDRLLLLADLAVLLNAANRQDLNEGSVNTSGHRSVALQIQAKKTRTDLEMLTFFRSTPCSSSDRANALKCIVPAR